MRFKAVLFDLDGVLFDGGPIHFQALNLALAECGYPKIGIEEHKSLFDGLPTKEKLKLLVTRGVVNTKDTDRIERAKKTRQKV